MLKKTGLVAAAAAGLLMLGAPAFAGENGDWHGHGHGHGVNNSYNGQIGLINFNDIDILKDINTNTVFGACGNNVGIMGLAAPILSPQITSSCAVGGIID